MPQALAVPPRRDKRRIERDRRGPGLQDDAAGRVEFVDAFHEKRTEAGEKIPGNSNFGTIEGAWGPRQGRQPIGESGQASVELVQ